MKPIKYTLATFLLFCVTISVVTGITFRPVPPANLSMQVVGNSPNSERSDIGIRLNFPDSHFHVVITNNSNRAVRLFEEWNSWGYYCLSFDLLDKNGKLIGSVEKGPAQWSRNGASYLNLRPRECHVIDVRWDTKWLMPIKPFPKSQGPTEYKLVARFSIAEDDATRRNNVWTGTIETKPQDILLGYWPKTAR